MSSAVYNILSRRLRCVDPKYSISPPSDRHAAWWIQSIFYLAAFGSTCRLVDPKYILSRRLRIDMPLGGSKVYSISPPSDRHAAWWIQSISYLAAFGSTCRLVDPKYILSRRLRIDMPLGGSKVYSISPPSDRHAAWWIQSIFYLAAFGSTCRFVDPKSNNEL